MSDAGKGVVSVNYIGGTCAMLPSEADNAVRTRSIYVFTLDSAGRSLRATSYTLPNSRAALRTSVQNCRTTADGSPRRDARLSTAFGCALPLMRR